MHSIWEGREKGHVSDQNPDMKSVAPRIIQIAMIIANTMYFVFCLSTRSKEFGCCHTLSNSLVASLTWIKERFVMVRSYEGIGAAGDGYARGPETPRPETNNQRGL
ncbi:hypothetical protein BDV36DRAFT_269802 [Aspergillus pseudocaelatus]|uniref:Uncharacterized protein n=1 Tax=Aspergillus pseudocaelatus TaxID=1825620 RepID=A0ABQ6W772_9EURO|nr:hypothetical protein BDV36DRAFT_269802 [Aspergillus pseudocaelatus]